MAMGWIEPRVRPVKRGQPLRSIVTGFGKLIVPTVLLVAVYVLSFYLLSNPVWFSFAADNPQADPAWWMSLGHLSLGFAFFLVMLTNRAHGPTMAIAQVVLAWAVIGGLLAFASSLYGFNEVRAELKPTQVMAAFMTGLFMAHGAGVLSFDWQRGVPWWKAPLVATFVGPLFFVLIFYPMGYWGADVPWGAWLWMHYAALTGLGLLLMVPYALLRGRVKPAPGLGGA